MRARANETRSQATRAVAQSQLRRRTVDPAEEERAREDGPTGRRGARKTGSRRHEIAKGDARELADRGSGATSLE